MMDDLFTPEVMAGIAAVNVAEYHRRVGMTERPRPLKIMWIDEPTPSQMNELLRRYKRN